MFFFVTIIGNWILEPDIDWSVSNAPPARRFGQIFQYVLLLSGGKWPFEVTKLSSAIFFAAGLAEEDEIGEMKPKISSSSSPIWFGISIVCFIIYFAVLVRPSCCPWAITCIICATPMILWFSHQPGGSRANKNNRSLYTRIFAQIHTRRTYGCTHMDTYASI